MKPLFLLAAASLLSPGHAAVLEKNPLSFENDPKAVAFSPDGAFVAARGLEGGRDLIKVWDMKTERPRIVIDAGLSATTESLSWSKDAKSILSGEGSSVTVWDAETGSKLRAFDDRSPSSGPALFLPGGEKIAAAMGRKILFWPLVHDKRAAVKTAADWKNEGSITALAASPSGELIAAAGTRSQNSGKGRIDVIEASEGWVLKTLLDDEVGFHCASFSPSGAVLAAGGARRTPEGSHSEIVFWETETWTELRRIVRDSPGEALAIMFSADGAAAAVVIAGEKEMPVYDLRTGKSLRSLPGVDVERYGAAALSKNGIAAASFSRGIRFWNTDELFKPLAPQPTKPVKRRPKGG